MGAEANTTPGYNLVTREVLRSLLWLPLGGASGSIKNALPTIVSYVLQPELIGINPQLKCQIVNRLMSGAKWRVHHTAATGDESYRQFVKGHVNGYLLKGASREKSSDGMHVGNKAFKRKSRRHSDNMLLGNTLHKYSLGVSLHQVS
jgi:hypothetical protein